jgi:RNase P subunit RPR2
MTVRTNVIAGFCVECGTPLNPVQAVASRIVMRRKKHVAFYYVCERCWNPSVMLTVQRRFEDLLRRLEEYEVNRKRKREVIIRVEVGEKEAGGDVQGTGGSGSVEGERVGSEG